MIYFIEAVGTNRVKIGYSANVLTRLEQLEAEYPLLTLRVWRVFDGGFQQEKAFHRHFAKARAKGEWFDLDAVKAESNDILHLIATELEVIDLGRKDTSITLRVPDRLVAGIQRYIAEFYDEHLIRLKPAKVIPLLIAEGLKAAKERDEAS